jgi:hypothetical protein
MKRCHRRPTGERPTVGTRTCSETAASRWCRLEWLQVVRIWRQATTPDLSQWATYHAVKVVRTERQKVASPGSSLFGGEHLLQISTPPNQQLGVLPEHLRKVNDLHIGKPRINVQVRVEAGIPRSSGRRGCRASSGPVVQLQNGTPVNEPGRICRLDVRRIHWLLPFPLGDVWQAT